MGERDGKGTYTYTDGARYVGDWKAGKQHGEGTLYNPDGSVKIKGRWENGNFIE